MPIPALPDSFVPLASGYSIKPAGGVISTPVGGGFARRVMAYDRGTYQMSVDFLLTPPQFQYWELFYLRTIKKGSLPFSMRIDSGFGVSRHDVWIIPDTIEISRSDLYYSLSFDLETESELYKQDTDVVDNYIIWLEAAMEAGEDVNYYINLYDNFANQDGTVSVIV